MNYQYRKADKGLYGPIKDSYDYDINYGEYLASLPRVASVPSCEWKDGEIVEEGKFKTQQWCSSRGHDELVQELPIESYLALDGNCPHCRLIAVPISGGEVKEAVVWDAAPKVPDEFKKGVDAGKETFTFNRRHMMAFAEAYPKMKKAALEECRGNKSKWVEVVNRPTSYWLDEYLNHINKQK